MSKSTRAGSERLSAIPTTRWSELARTFAIALRQPSQPVPDPVGKTDGALSIKRFNVYRNNVAVSLRAALAATYPVVKALVGEEFFAAMVRAYVASRLPSSPVLISYGRDFPDFIETFEPAGQLPYLPDVARVEWSFNESYNAADATPITIDALSALDADALERVRFVLHPSLRLVRSRWPVLSIWHAHQQDDPTAHLPGLAKARAESGFLVRPELEVRAIIFPAEGFQLLAALVDGETPTQAAAALTQAAKADLSAMLASIFSAGAVVDLATGQTESFPCRSSGNATHSPKGHNDVEQTQRSLQRLFRCD